MNTNFQAQRLMSLQAITYSAYGVDILDAGANPSPLQFDAFDLWLGDDFDYVLDNICPYVRGVVLFLNIDRPNFRRHLGR